MYFRSSQDVCPLDTRRDAATSTCAVRVWSTCAGADCWLRSRGLMLGSAAVSRHMPMTDPTKPMLHSGGTGHCCSWPVASVGTAQERAHHVRQLCRGPDPGCSKIPRCTKAFADTWDHLPLRVSGIAGALVSIWCYKKERATLPQITPRGTACDTNVGRLGKGRCGEQAAWPARTAQTCGMGRTDRQSAPPESSEQPMPNADRPTLSSGRRRRVVVVVVVWSCSLYVLMNATREAPRGQPVGLVAGAGEEPGPSDV